MLQVKTVPRSVRSIIVTHKWDGILRLSRDTVTIVQTRSVKLTAER